MDPIKKRKLEEKNSTVKVEIDSFVPLMLTHEDSRKMVDILTHDQLLGIVQNALLRHPDVLDAVRLFANRESTHRKLFVRGLGWETTTEALKSIFSSYGELAEAVVIQDKDSGKSRGYGFVTFKHIDGAIMALKDPSKEIDGRMTVTQLASSGVPIGGATFVGGISNVVGVGRVTNHSDVAMRKIYVGNVPLDMEKDRLLKHFLVYGEVEEGPIGFDKKGMSRGYALFVYKTVEAAQSSLVDPIKNVDGHQLYCKLANDSKTGKPPIPLGDAVAGLMGDGIGATILGGQYGGPGNVFSSGLYAGVGRGVGGPVLPLIGCQSDGSNLGVSVGFISTIGGPYTSGSHLIGANGTGYGGSGGLGAGLGGTSSGLGAGAGLGGAGGGFGGARTGLGGARGGFSGFDGSASGISATGRGLSLYSLPPTSVGIGYGDQPKSVHYSLSSPGYQVQRAQHVGASSTARVPPGGAFHGMSLFY